MENNGGWREKEFLKSSDMAEILGISLSAAYELAHSLPNVRVGKSIRVRTVCLEKYIRDQERKER